MTLNDVADIFARLGYTMPDRVKNKGCRYKRWIHRTLHRMKQEEIVKFLNILKDKMKDTTKNDNA